VNLPSWMDVVTPHKDIADGSFDESLFAADLGLVDRGRGPADYLDARTFCEKTHLTANLRDALSEVTRRLTGDPSAAGVYRLQTEFGGGKTHTLLAAYHLFRDPAAVSDTDVAIKLREATGVQELPQVNVVVLDGSSLLAGEPERFGNVQIRTLLGHLAYRLGGGAAYDLIEQQDEKMLGSSTHQLAELLERYSPCLILLDETLEYLNKSLAVPTHDGNLAATTLTSIKELCTAVANVQGAALVATLTSSRLEDYATVAGQEMQERLSKVVGRTENIVTPVEGDDIFPILHRRLFVDVADTKVRQTIAAAYGQYYESLGDVLSGAYREASYRDRIVSAYPFHPELVDILTNRWGSLSGFQRTRGALRTLAHTVKALSQREHAGSLIHPGDVPLDDAGIRAEILRFAGDSYKAALNADIIRADSKAPEEDKRRGGDVAKFHLATRLAATAFLNSFGAEKVVGASSQQMLVGVGAPGLSRGVIEDVRDALVGALWYMRYEGGRYRFTTEPNLNKVIVEREGSIPDEAIEDLVWAAVGSVGASGPTLRVDLRVRTSADLSDEPRLRLGILDFDQRLNGEYDVEALSNAESILSQRGGVDRTNKNAVMLVAADAPALLKARATARTVAAMRDLRSDRHRLGRFNAEQKEQLEERLKGAEQRLPQQVVMCFRHLLLLGNNGDGGSKLDHVDLGPAKVDATIPGRVLEYLRNTDRLLETTLAPAALLSGRFGLIGDAEQAVELDRLLAYFYRLPRLPKLASPDVLRNCLIQGVTHRVFGVASGSSWDATDAVLRFGEVVDSSEIQFQPGIHLVRASAIAELLARQGPQEEGPLSSQPSEPATAPETPSDLRTPESTKATVAHVIVTVTGVPPDKARDVLKTAIMPLAAESTEVRIDFRIEAKGGPAGIPRNTLDLVVKEGLKQLGLSNVEITERQD
jgi:hypothetical protein